MKQGPDLRRIEDNMRSGTLAAHQFLGSDLRSLADIILHDRLLLEPLGLTNEDLGERMRYFTEQATESQVPQVVDGKFEVRAGGAQGGILCPFADNFQASKSIIRVKNLETDKSVVWSDLNIHLIEEHGFYEGWAEPRSVLIGGIRAGVRVQKHK